MAERIQMPQSGGGLIRYSDDYKGKIQVGPMAVITMILVVIFVELLLHTLLS